MQQRRFTQRACFAVGLAISLPVALCSQTSWAQAEGADSPTDEAAFGDSSIDTAPESTDADIDTDASRTSAGDSGAVSNSITDTAVTDTSSAPATSSAPVLNSSNAQTPDSQRIFGAYRVRLAILKPKFDDGLDLYRDFYGNEKWYPQLAADWFAWDWFVTFGLSFRAGYYSADGHNAETVPGKGPGEYASSDIVKDRDSPATLTLVPMQALLTMEFTPFERKWLVLDGWFGLERLYFQEVRKPQAAAAAAMLAVPDDEETGDALTNKGFKNATVFGFSANILLNGLDQTSASSLGVIGLGYVYLSPFMEVVRTMKKDGASFGRSSYGIGFTFESLH